MLSFFKSEYILFLAITTAMFFIFFGDLLLGDLNNIPLVALAFGIIFLVMLMSSFSVVRHADELAVKLGEPYGTLILTLSVITIEVVAISAVMLTGADNPTLGRDMMFSVIMITLNGLVGLSLLVGGMKHMQQEYNLQGVNSFIALIFPLAVLGLILPNFTLSSAYGTFSTFQTYFLIFVTVALYLIFLFMQTLRHKNFFVLDHEVEEKHQESEHSLTYHISMLIAYLVPIVLLSKKLAIVVNHSISEVGAPAALGGLLVAILVLSPEGMSAIKAALNNKLQRAINISMGSALATISLTIPAVLLIGLATGEKVVLGLNGVDTVVLLLTLFMSILNFSSGKSNIIQGLIHIMLFVLYLLLIFD
jgi:Ca2+:H+ antiporter